MEKPVILGILLLLGKLTYASLVTPCFANAGYFVDAVISLGGCAQRVRADLGTENRHVEQLQLFLRDNADKCFLYGKSTANQRIEWFWGLLRREAMQVYMNKFAKLKDDGYFTGEVLDKCLIQFCFMDAVQVTKPL